MKILQNANRLDFYIDKSRNPISYHIENLAVEYNDSEEKIVFTPLKNNFPEESNKIEVKAENYENVVGYAALKAALVTTVSNVLKFSQASGASASLTAEYLSPIDFSTQRLTASTIKLINTNFPILNASQIKFITISNAANTETKNYQNGIGGVHFTYDGTDTIGVLKDGVACNCFDVGTGLTVTYTVTTGAISAITAIANGGSGYFTGGIVTVSGGGANATLLITATNGVVTAASIISGGSGYSNGTAVETTLTSAVLDAQTVIGIDSITKGYDRVTDTNKGFISNYPVQPLHNVLIAPSTSVIADSWFPSKDGVDVGVYKTHTFTGILAPATSQVLTITLEGTNADDLTVDANWTALDFFNVASLTVVKTLATSAGTSTPFNLRITDCGYRNIRFRLTPSVNTNANTCNAYLNSIY